MKRAKWFNILLVSIIQASCLQHSNSDVKNHEQLGYNYSRDLDFVYYRGERIDQTTPKDIEFLRSYLKRPLVTPANADCRSFKPLSEQYSKDKNRAYFRWIRGGKQFWLVEITEADPESFEVLGSSLAKDKNHVWRKDTKVAGADAETTEAFTGRVWKDRENAWFCGVPIKGVDVDSFEPVGDGYHYRDVNKVYWIFNVVKVVKGANPQNFSPRPHKTTD